MAPTAPTTTTSTTSVPAHTTPFTKNKWAISLSTVPLTPAQGSPYNQGTQLHNSAQVSPQGNLHCSGRRGMHQTSPHGDRGTQGGIQPLPQEKLPPPKPNITLKEQKAISKCKEDQSQLVLMAD